jgi:hypothetical protein
LTSAWNAAAPSAASAEDVPAAANDSGRGEIRRSLDNANDLQESIGQPHVEVIRMWIFSRRVNIAAAATIWAVAFYTLFGYLFVERIDYMFVVHQFMSGDVRRLHGSMRDDIFPWRELLLAGSYLPLSFCVYGFCRGMRRRYRVRHDLCAMCGHHLTSWYGHCPNCGMRIGPDRPNQVHVLRG